MFTWKEIIDIAVQIENNGEEIYRRAAREAGSRELSTALARLADDEAGHARWFAQLPPADMKAELGGEQASDLDKMARALMRDAMADKALSLETTDFTGMTHVHDVIQKSIDFEQDTILFYELIRQFVAEDSALALIDTIIAEEKEHVAALKEMGAVLS